MNYKDFYEGPPGTTSTVAAPTAALVRAVPGIARLALHNARLGGAGVALLADALRSPSVAALASLKLNCVVSLAESYAGASALCAVLRDPRCRLRVLELNEDENEYEVDSTDLGWTHASLDAVLDAAVPALERLILPTSRNARVQLDRELRAAAVRGERRAVGARACDVVFA